MTDLLASSEAPPTVSIPIPAARRRRRVVLLSYHYPPDHAVGGLRPARLARALAAAGYEVRVVTAERAGDAREAQTQGQAIQVKPVRMQPSPRAALIQLRNEFRGELGRQFQSEGDWAVDPVSHQDDSAWKRRLLSLLWLPDDLQGFIIPAARGVLEQVRQGCDLIYTSGPPFSTHLAGWLSRSVAKVPWFAEFRDPWTDNPGKPGFVRSAVSDSVERWLEQRVLNRADGIVAVTPVTGRLLAAKLPPGLRDRVTVALSGIDNLRDELSEPPAGPLRIVYTGNLYLGRDPRPFLTGLAEARRKLGLGPAQIRVDFVGDCLLFKGASVRAMAEGFGLGDLVHFTTWASPETCRSLQENADLLLLLAEGQPLQVPNKLYEYLGTRRPILAFVDADGETSQMLARAGGHLVVADRRPETAAAATIRGLQQARTFRACGDPAVLREWTSQAQMSALIHWMETRR